jgi:AmpE protein
MSLLSLLIALFSEKHLPGNSWQFDSYFNRYVGFYKKSKALTQFKKSSFSYAIFLLLPPIVLFIVLNAMGDGLLNLILSTLVLITTLGCKTTRNTYREYLNAAYRGDTTTTEMHHLQLLEDKNLPALGFGQALVWLNYRYYIAIMLFFIFFGAAGALFYRLLTSATEFQDDCLLDDGDENTNDNSATNNTENKSQSSEDANANSNVYTTPNVSNGCKNYHDVLFYVDWLPVRISSLGYMLVGHFSKALPTWLESAFNTKKANCDVLIEVAQQSEDITVDNDDCSAEPTLLVHLAKRNVLLILSILSILILAGVIR